MKFFLKTKKKNPTLTMKLWTESVWDWLAVAQTNRKSKQQEQNEDEEEETQNEEQFDDEERWSQEQRKKNTVAKNRGRKMLEPRTLGLIKMVKLESLKVES